MLMSKMYFHEQEQHISVWALSSDLDSCHDSSPMKRLVQREESTSCKTSKPSKKEKDKDAVPLLTKSGEDSPLNGALKEKSSKKQVQVEDRTPRKNEKMSSIKKPEGITGIHTDAELPRDEASEKNAEPTLLKSVCSRCMHPNHKLSYKDVFKCSFVSTSVSIVSQETMPLEAFNWEVEEFSDCIDFFTVAYLIFGFFLGLYRVLIATALFIVQGLVECEGGSIDMSGDVGAVGRLIMSDGPTENQEMFLDLKGMIYKTTIVPSRTFCIVSFGQSEAKIEAIVNDFIRLKPQSNMYEAETMVEGTLDGFSFDLEDEADKIPKSVNHQADPSEGAEGTNPRKRKGEDWEDICMELDPKKGNLQEERNL
ncbi:hypothetical protein RJ641_007842 [Dillenia turbinata]|uniref:Uncharacterized protein n=1 Tax=Dillenia turbinata TaxID=194707 RepID=A0AAN8V028_9MAGN